MSIFTPLQMKTPNVFKQFPKVHKFLNRKIEEDVRLSELVEEYSNYAVYDSSVWGSSDYTLSRDIPQMLKDPIIQSGLATLMETAFQPDEDQKIMTVKSNYPILKKELDEFHERTNRQTFVLTLAYNLLIWGNLPIRHVFNDKGELDFVVPIADFTSVIPIVFANTNLGFLVDGEYHFPYEYSYAQFQFYKNLGGSDTSKVSSLYSYSNSEKDSLPFTNEFVFAPSYLTTAVQPWRNLRIIEDALLLNRMDQSNYYRLILVGVGGDVYSKPATRILNYYRDLFKKVRRISYDSSGMASKGRNQEFEVILPQTDRQKVEIKDIGGQIEVKAIEDMDKQLNKLFAALRIQPWMIGYSSDAPSDWNGAAGYLMDARLAKVARTLIFSVTRTLSEIDTVYLRSRGFNVTSDMWSYNTVSSTILEDKSKAETLKLSLDNLKSVVDQFNAMQLEYNKKYLVESLLGPAFASVHIDTTELLTVSPEDKKPEISQDITSSYFQKIQDNTLKVITSSVLKDTPVGKDLEAYFTALKNEEAKTNPETLLSDANLKPTEPTKAPTFKVSSASQKVSLVAAMNDMVPFGGDTEIDISPISVLSAKDSKALTDDWNTLVSSHTTKVNSCAFIPTSSKIIIPSDVKVTVQDLNSASLKPLNSAITVPGGILLQSKDDVVTYLYHKKAGISTVVARNMITNTIQKY